MPSNNHSSFEIFSSVHGNADAFVNTAVALAIGNFFFDTWNCLNLVHDASATLNILRVSYPILPYPIQYTNSVTDLQIMAMADPSIHGKDNVTNMMREIDAESPWPDEGLDFVTLWCRAVNVSCSEWKFMLR